MSPEHAGVAAALARLRGEIVADSARIRAIGPAVERALGDLERFLAKAIGEATGSA